MVDTAAAIASVGSGQLATLRTSDLALRSVDVRSNGLLKYDLEPDQLRGPRTNVDGSRTSKIAQPTRHGDRAPPYGEAPQAPHDGLTRTSPHSMPMWTGSRPG